jgi:hypothetical protein
LRASVPAMAHISSSSAAAALPRRIAPRSAAARWVPAAWLMGTNARSRRACVLIDALVARACASVCGTHTMHRIMSTRTAAPCQCRRHSSCRPVKRERSKDGETQRTSEMQRQRMGGAARRCCRMGVHASGTGDGGRGCGFAGKHTRAQRRESAQEA